jgi:hypothetical protein
MNVAGSLEWIQRNRKWLAIGIALIMPWVYLVGLDRLLRRKR